MENRIKEIGKLEREIEGILTDIDSHYKTLGELVARNESGEYKNVIKAKKLGPEITEYKKISASYSNAENQNEKLQQFKKKVSEIAAEIKKTRKKINDIENENEKHYSELAETAYALYRRDPEKLSDFEPYLHDVVEIDKKTMEVDLKLQGLKREKTSSFLDKVKETGEKTLLYSRKKINMTVMAVAMKNAGKKICRDRIYEKMGDREVEGVFSSLAAARKVQEELELKIETYEAETGNYEKEIEEINLEFGNNPEAYLKNILSAKESFLKEFGKKIFLASEEDENDSAEVDEGKIDSESEAYGIVSGIRVSL